MGTQTAHPPHPTHLAEADLQATIRALTDDRERAVEPGQRADIDRLLAAARADLRQAEKARMDAKARQRQEDDEDARADHAIRRFLLRRQAELSAEVTRTERQLDELIGLQVFGDNGRDLFATANRERMLRGLRAYNTAVRRALAEVNEQIDTFPGR